MGSGGWSDKHQTVMRNKRLSLRRVDKVLCHGLVRLFLATLCSASDLTVLFALQRLIAIFVH